MKILGTDVRDERDPVREGFGEVLRRSPEPRRRTTTPVGVSGPTVAALLAETRASRTLAQLPGTTGRLGSAEQLSQVRQGLHVEGARLRDVRKEADTAHEERVDARVLDLLVQELTAEFSSKSTPRPPPSVGGRLAAATAVSDGTGQPGVPGRTVDGSAPASELADDRPGAGASPLDAIQAVIERITLFMGEPRPAIALSVKGQLGAEVHLERTGPNEVAIRVKGHRGPPAPELIALMREELQSRGIRLSSLSLA